MGHGTRTRARFTPLFGSLIPHRPVREGMREPCGCMHSYPRVCTLSQRAQWTVPCVLADVVRLPLAHVSGAGMRTRVVSWPWVWDN